MSFLQPFILWGLPLVLVPVIIHLLNRMRYRTVAWAAMMFLLTASKQATRQARVREWLILAMRILAVLTLLFFLSRPMVGGWLGSAAGNQPDTIIVLLDRSPSMEVMDAQTRMSKRALALRRLAEAASESGGGSRYVLIDSATRQPQEFSSPAVLKDLSVAGPSDAAADIPAMLDAALDYLKANQAGRAEIWLCSDLQKSNWQPDAPGWGTVRERFKQQASDTRVRLLALTQTAQENIGVRVTDVARRRTSKGYELQITAELTGQGAASATFPLTIVHEGARSQVEVNFGGQKLTTQCRLDLGPRQSAGWGWVELPADANPRDNQSFFVYPEDLQAKSVVVADAEAAGRFLRLAAAPAPLLLNQVAEVQSASGTLKLDDTALLIWQSAAPSGTVENVVRDFVGTGGVVLYLPATTGDDGKFRVATWRNSDGPLGKTQDGKDLPLPEVVFTKRTTLSSEGSVLAMFDDSKPFLTKQPFGRGAFYQCASLPLRDWSSLGEGTVLVPMVQRLVQEGARRLGHIVDADVGDTRFLRANNLAASDNKGAVSVKAVAGIYQQDTKLVAANRPAREDEPDRLDETSVRDAMGTIPYRLFEEKGAGSAALQTEIWRWFLIAMLLFLTGEAIFSLPTAAQTKRWDVPGERVAFGKETPVAGGQS
jgi:hypothetical protein